MKVSLALRAFTPARVLLLVAFAAAVAPVAGVAMARASQRAVQEVTSSDLPAAAVQLATSLEPVSAGAGGRVDLATMCARGQLTSPSASTAAYDRRHARWIVLDVGREPGEPPWIQSLGVATTSAEVAYDPHGAGVAAFCDLVRRDTDLVATPDLVDGAANELHALGAARALVRFGSWYLYADTTSPGTDALHMFRAGGGDHAVLATRPETVGTFPQSDCGAGGRQSGAQCFTLRAWISISSVRRAPDGSSLLVQGHRGPADHAHAGPFHWVVPLRAP